MSNLYEKIVNANPNLEVENLVLPPGIGNPDPSSPGQQILALAVQRTGNIVATGVDDLYNAFTTTPLRVSWEWRPAGTGYSANRFGVLDGSKLFGECKHFACALWLLARAPQPFGLGLPHSQVKLEVYTGESGKGFVSNHSRRYLQLSKNVKRPPSNVDRLYYWENHKTVSFNSVYYDVCYQTTYAHERDMSVYTLTGIFTPKITDRPGFLAEKAQRRTDGRYFWFKRLEPSDNVVNPHRTWLGPIDETTFEVAYMPKKLSVV